MVMMICRQGHLPDPSQESAAGKSLERVRDKEQVQRFLDDCELEVAPSSILAPLDPIFVVSFYFRVIFPALMLLTSGVDFSGGY